jgi:hypothetical protein
MRNSLFWRILAVGLLPLIILYIYFNASGSADFIHAHIPFVLLVVGVLQAALTSSAAISHTPSITSPNTWMSRRI